MSQVQSQTGVWIANGNEAIGYAALHAGVDFFAHYPGSPVNGVEPHLKHLNTQHQRGIIFNDALNEHVAALSAMGASMAGARSMLVMKHVGLNIAADPLNYVGYAGVRGGMVIIVGTDPGANSSTGEEDVHWYAKQFNLPLFEPTHIQEIYDTVIDAFDLSESLEIPVMVFVTGLICHNTAPLKPRIAAIKTKQFGFVKDRAKYINVGNRAVVNHRQLLEKIARYGEQQHGATLYGSGQATTLCITRGNTHQHVLQALELLGLSQQVDVLNVVAVFPIPKSLMAQQLQNRTRILFLEDQDGFLENQTKMELFHLLKCDVHGKDLVPAYGEITAGQVTQILADFMGVPYQPITLSAVEVPERLGTFCEGCPHTSSYFAIEQAIPAETRVIGGDIGCSSLPPFKADWLLCMNAGVGISQGMRPFLPHQSIVSTGGDGSFFHAGLLSVMNAVQNQLPLLHVVFDNRSVAMTGHQTSASTSVDYQKLIEACGVDSFTEVNAFKPIEIADVIRSKEQLQGVHVVWISGSCARIPDPVSTYRRANLYPEIQADKCGDCTLCYETLACPAIVTNENQQFEINLDRCMRCGVCHEICPNDAITIHQIPHQHG